MMTHLDLKHSSMSLRVFGNCIGTLKCYLSLTRALVLPSANTLRHVSLRTCHSLPVSFVNLCCQRARCASPSTQQAGSRPADVANIKAAVAFHFSRASALKVAANKGRSKIETQTHTSLHARCVGRSLSPCLNEGCRNHRLMEWMDAFKATAVVGISAQRKKERNSKASGCSLKITSTQCELVG